VTLKQSQPGGAIDKVLLLRSDANSRIGTGHTMRQYALGQGWIDRGGRVALAECMYVPAVDDRLRRDGIDIVHLTADPGGQEDAEAVAALARKLGATWVAIDGYWFTSAYRTAARARGTHMLCVDDEGLAEPYLDDVVLNQNLHADEDMYRSGEDTTLLLGPRYVTLRREFRRAARLTPRAIPRTALRMLITLGGSDPHNVTTIVLRALELVAIDHMSVSVVVGGGNPRKDEIAQIGRASRHRVEVLKDVKDMASIMKNADMAITAGGTTVWELAALGTPSIVGATTSIENRTLEGLTRSSLFEPFGSFQDIQVDELAKCVESLAQDPDRRRDMQTRARRMVDGLGCARVVSMLLHLSSDSGQIA
jgi:UDP-2,4-diacetamido-2,4,6-trideoxy-beta-L-altropyranose hydrolase